MDAHDGGEMRVRGVSSLSVYIYIIWPNMIDASQDWKLECCYAADNIGEVLKWNNPMKCFLKSPGYFKAKAADAKFRFAFTCLADTFTQTDL